MPGGKAVASATWCREGCVSSHTVQELLQLQNKRCRERLQLQSCGASASWDSTGCAQNSLFLVWAQEMGRQIMKAVTDSHEGEAAHAVAASF